MEYSLNGTWELFWDDGLRGGARCWQMPEHVSHRKIFAQVPGEVHLDLMRAGILDDIYKDGNVYKARWVEECTWNYRKTFEAPEDASRAKRVFLDFKGLDYTAKIYLNGSLVDTHDNFFLPCCFEVSDFLKAGTNLLSIVLESGLLSAGEKETTPYRDATFSNDLSLHKRMWLRKPQNSFGWDWSPRLVNVGMHGDVALLWDNGVCVSGASMYTDLSPGFDTGTVTVRAFYNSQQTASAEVEISVGYNGCVLEKQQEMVKINAGEGEIDITATVNEPALWYPVGYGAQALYTVDITVKIEGQVLYSKNFETGFRQIVWNQDVHPQEGNYCIPEVNGIKIFAKGANLVPADIIYANIDSEKYDTLIQRAVECNMNFLRVWGGGIYESDYFYELCNRKGILVWQEFIFACATYPATNSEFLTNVKKEAVYQVRRLANNPSLIAWCGNNEIQDGVWHLEGDYEYPDYALYHYILPTILQKEDTTKYYQPSSPYTKFTQGISKNTEGDQHPWLVGINEHDFWKYRGLCCRFPNEGGFMGPASLAAYNEFLKKENRAMHSFAFDTHDNMFGDYSEKSSPDIAVKLWLDKDAANIELEEYVYWGGFLQGEALQEYITNFRRFKFDCAAAVFWMYNDAWPASRSWTVVDYFGNRTPSFYPVKRAFAPVIVVVSVQSREVFVYGVNDTLLAWQGELAYGVCSPNTIETLQSAHAVLPPNSAGVVAKFTLPEGFTPRRQLPFAWLQKEGKIISSHRQFQVRYYEFEWEKAQIKVCREKGRLRMVSNAFVCGVCIDLCGQVQLQDNVFDLYPNQIYSVDVPEDLEITSIRSFQDAEVIWCDSLDVR